MKPMIARRVFVAACIASAIVGDVNAAAEEWKQYADLEKAGWSATQLEEARKFATTIGSASVLIVDHGHVVAAWGPIDYPYKAASIRKSLYDAAIGATQLEKPFDVNTPIGQLKIDDLNPLTDEEKRATFENLLTARSGIYLPAAYETRSNADRRPERGSAKPGVQWYYNNWDFNVLCVAFAQLAGETVDHAFSERLAKPLGMEDFRPEHVFRSLEPRVSRYPAITFRISARDLARIGLLYLQKGRWGDKQIISADWVQRSTEPRTVFGPGHYRGEGNGYGRLWWIFPARPERHAPYEDYRRIAARGTGGQLMVLFPDLDMLIVHRADTGAGRGVSDHDSVKLLNMIVGARKDAPPADAPLELVRVHKLSGQTPEPWHNDLTSIPNARRIALEGRYKFEDGTGVQLYQFEDRLFARPLGMPLPDAELLQAPNGALRSPIVSVVFEPILKGDGAVEALRMTFRGRTQTGTRSD